MLVYLKFIGITNAAVWLGASLFFICRVEPAFASPEIAAILPPSHAGATAQILLERYFSLHCWCGGLALVHLLGEWLYSGRPLRRWALYLVLGLFGWGLVGSFWLQPKLQKLHLEIYGVRSTPPQRQQASKSFKIWHALNRGTNLAALLGIWVFLLQSAAAGSTPRFLGSGKFRG